MGTQHPHKEPELELGSNDQTTSAVQGSIGNVGRGMRSPRTRSSKGLLAGKPLIPLSVARNERLSHLLEVIEPQRTRDELILNSRNVRTFIGLLDEFKHADTLRRHSLNVRSKLLFCGPPGCGKTITAEVFANELGLPLLVARLDGIISSFLGETASNLTKVFESANERPSVLFLDEFDALARSRGDRAEHNELRRVVNSLLMMIDRFHGRGFLIAATNLEGSLDPAIWRRFDEVILFDLPQEQEIRRLLKLKTRNFSIAFDIEAKAPRLKGLSYADIERICINSIKRTIMRGLKSLPESEFNLALREERMRHEVQDRLTKG